MQLERINTLFTGLAQAYVKREATLASLFPYDHRSLESYWRHSKWLDEYSSLPRQALSNILVQEQRRLATLTQSDQENKTIEAAKKLGQDNSLVVVTGQQAGLFTGPHLTLLKAFTAIAKARQLSIFLDRPVIPLFWIASEDHDVEEVSKASVAIGEQVHTLSIPVGEEKKPIAHTKLPEDWEQIVKIFTSYLPNNEKGRQWKCFLEQLTEKTNTLNEAFALILYRITAPYGLVLFDPMNKAIKELPATKSFFTQLIKDQKPLSEAFHQGCEKIRALGYEPQVQKSRNQLFLFYHDQDERKVLIREEEDRCNNNNKDFYRLRGTDRTFTTDDLIARANKEPHLFSSNVISRPLWQDRLLPTIAYVAGPSEIAYFASYGEIYRALNQPMPPIFPRFSVTFIESHINKILHRYDSTFFDFRNNFDEMMIKALKEQDTLSIHSLFATLREDITEAYGKVHEPILDWDIKIGALTKENLERVLGQIDYLEKKVQQRHRQNCQELKSHFAKLKSHLLPDNRPQERMLTSLPYLIKYENLLDKLLELPLDAVDSHVLITL
ncbi:bacillithiol biosynthesis cysteine-adding enzyme BshC [Heliorestis convoluta]|uniref:Putative cysteine ligase BshC n=1 Tax=Heliorestis convoluta TaxID=356322 RepID=A0A5Q2N3V5_9FIRM|nr:bacillithiol biosynthesis cysteine-adding enzyme BshC [Heliorestis convoluta]QGG46950.1 bacillithiol biosynthesis cysteine-adding enzyme BshC [Heliorestis convoluta]